MPRTGTRTSSRSARATRRWRASRGGCQVREARVALLERELLEPGRPVAVLREDDLRDAGRLGLLRVVVLVARSEERRVGKGCGSGWSSEHYDKRRTI